MGLNLTEEIAEGYALGPDTDDLDLGRTRFKVHLKKS